jgi:hypothetical protein
MNGRLYDPVVGRMLSPDNYVIDGSITQPYNRYAYALNNPLKYTDPDGEWVHIAIGALVGGIVNGLRHRDGNGGFWKGFAIGAVAGAVTAATGGAAVGALGLASTGIVSGLVSGAAGAIVGSPVQAVGNYVIFGDKYSLKNFGTDVLISTVSGGVVGGVGALVKTALGNPTNVFWGTSAKNIWSFTNKPVFKEIEIGDLTYGAIDCEECDEIRGVLRGSADNVNKFVTNSSIDVYRSVSFGEYQSILKEGYKFTPGVNSYDTGKLFAASYQDANYFSKMFGNSIIVKARIPIGTTIERIFGTDGLKYIYNVPLDMLPKVHFLTVFK